MSRLIPESSANATTGRIIPEESSADGGGGFGKIHREYIESELFEYSIDSGLSTVNLSKIPTTDLISVNMRELYRNGVVDSVMVDLAPTASNQWRIVNGVLEIFGDVTGEGDTYIVRYPHR
jgi:hypothetical protein